MHNKIAQIRCYLRRRIKRFLSAKEQLLHEFRAGGESLQNERVLLSCHLLKGGVHIFSVGGKVKVLRVHNAEDEFEEEWRRSAHAHLNSFYVDIVLLMQTATIDRSEGPKLNLLVEFLGSVREDLDAAWNHSVGYVHLCYARVFRELTNDSYRVQKDLLLLIIKTWVVDKLLNVTN